MPNKILWHVQYINKTNTMRVFASHTTSFAGGYVCERLRSLNHVGTHAGKKQTPRTRMCVQPLLPRDLVVSSKQLAN